jgi:hypothetical protein
MDSHVPAAVHVDPWWSEERRDPLQLAAHTGPLLEHAAFLRHSPMTTAGLASTHSAQAQVGRSQAWAEVEAYTRAQDC